MAIKINMVRSIAAFFFNYVEKDITCYAPRFGSEKL